MLPQLQCPSPLSSILRAGGRRLRRVGLRGVRQHDARDDVQIALLNDRVYPTLGDLDAGRDPRAARALRARPLQRPKARLALAVGQWILPSASSASSIQGSVSSRKNEEQSTWPPTWCLRSLSRRRAEIWWRSGSCGVSCSLVNSTQRHFLHAYLVTESSSLGSCSSTWRGDVASAESIDAEVSICFVEQNGNNYRVPKYF